MAMMIDVDALIQAMKREDRRTPGIPWSITGVQRLASQIPAVDVYTADQVSEIIRQSKEVMAENGPLRIGLAFLKNCINCEIRNDCPWHCGKVVHDCDHWKYGDPSKNAAPVVHGRWVHCNGESNLWYCSECGEKIRYNPSRRTYNIVKRPVQEVNKYCRGCGAKMDSGENS